MTDPQHDTGNGAREIARRISALSPEKRALLEARLEGRPSIPSGQPAEAPLSFAQDRIYKLARANPESAFFTRLTRASLPPWVGLPALRAGIASLAERH